MYYVGANRDGDQRLKKAMLVACVAHVALAFGISFNMPEQSNSSARQIEVTLAMQPSAAAPLDARMLAQPTGGAGRRESLRSHRRHHRGPRGQSTRNT